MDFFPMHAWHPMLVHFPLGLLLGGAAVEAAGWISRRAPLRRAGLALLTAGLLLALPAIVTGLLAYNRVDHSDASHALMEWHRNLMLGAVALFAVLVVWRWRAGERVAATRTRAGLYAMLLAAASVILTIGADRGADLVYGHATGLASPRLEEILRDRVGMQLPASGSAGGEAPERAAPGDSTRPHEFTPHTH